MRINRYFYLQWTVELSESVFRPKRKNNFVGGTFVNGNTVNCYTLDDLEKD